MHRIALLLAALTVGCDVKLQDGTIVERGQRVAVRIMCPGSPAMDGWYENAPAPKGPGLTDSEGRQIANSSRCAWLVTGSKTPNVAAKATP